MAQSPSVAPDAGEVEDQAGNLRADLDLDRPPMGFNSAAGTIDKNLLVEGVNQEADGDAEFDPTREAGSGGAMGAATVVLAQSTGEGLGAMSGAAVDEGPRPAARHHLDQPFALPLVPTCRVACAGTAGPAVEPRVDHTLGAEAIQQRAPLSALLDHAGQHIQHLQVR